MQQNNPLRQLYIENYAHLIRTARSFVNADLAEDLVQETFLIAQKRLDRVVNSPNPTAWLVKTEKCNWKYISETALHLYRTDS